MKGTCVADRWEAHGVEARLPASAINLLALIS